MFYNLHSMPDVFKLTTNHCAQYYLILVATVIHISELCDGDDDDGMGI